MKKNINQIIQEKTVSLEEAFGDFTPEDEKKVQDLIRYYKVLQDLRVLRKKMGWTQEKLARRSSLPRTTISKIESGAHNPTLSTLMAIASALGKQLHLQLL